MGDSTPAGRFLDAAIGLLARVRDEEAAHIAAAGAAVADTVAAGGRLFAFGAGHSSLPAQDVVYRAGGLALMNLLAVPGAVGVDVTPATLGSALERVEARRRGPRRVARARRGPAGGGLAVRAQRPARRDGRRCPRARPEGRRRHLRGVRGGNPPRNSSGTFLRDHCDIVLDSKIAVGDAELTHEGAGAPFAPASTIVAGALMQAVVAAAAGELVRRGIDPRCCAPATSTGATSGTPA